jgi:hypothetical protein
MNIVHDAITHTDDSTHTTAVNRIFSELRHGVRGEHYPNYYGEIHSKNNPLSDTGYWNWQRAIDQYLIATDTQKLSRLIV